MVPSELEVVGVLPEVEGRVLEGFRIEGYVYEGTLESRCHIAYWRMEGQWWRTFAEGYALHIRHWNEEPVSWDAGPEHFYPVKEVAQDCYGAPLNLVEIFIFNDCPALRLGLEDGRVCDWGWKMAGLSNASVMSRAFAGAVPSCVLPRVRPSRSNPAAPYPSRRNRPFSVRHCLRP